MQVNILERLFAAAMLIGEVHMVEVDAAVGDGLSGWEGSAISGTSFRTSAIRRPLAALMVIMTKIIESIIRDMRTLIT